MSPESKVAIAATRVASLTERQAQVLVMLADGLYEKEMADRLKIYPSTAGYHVQRVYKRLGVDDRALATRVAVKAGLVD